VEIIRRNFALKALALAVAIAGWAYFRFAGSSAAGSPAFQQLSIPVNAANLALGYVARFTDREAVVTVENKPGDTAVKPEQIKAVLDLQNKGAGVYNVPVQLVAPDVAVQSLSPASVTLTIERIEERSFPITLHYVGGHPANIVVTYTAIGPDTAVVRAPTSVLAQVAGLHADVMMPTAPKSMDAMVRPVAVDASGAELAGVAVTPNLVRVQMHVVAGTGAR
jgi:YbbR domain-containing protein